MPKSNIIAGVNVSALTVLMASRSELLQAVSEAVQKVVRKKMKEYVEHQAKVLKLNPVELAEVQLKLAEFQLAAANRVEHEVIESKKLARDAYLDELGYDPDDLVAPKVIDKMIRTDRVRAAARTISERHRMLTS